MMKTSETAHRYFALARQAKWPDILDELCSKVLVNKEPDHVQSRGIPVTTLGLDAIKAKGNANRELIEAIHSQHRSDPLVAGNFFTVTLTRDVTFKGRPRMTLSEIAVFEVKEGKIVSEQFFY